MRFIVKRSRIFSAIFELLLLFVAQLGVFNALAQEVGRVGEQLKRYHIALFHRLGEGVMKRGVVIFAFEQLERYCDGSYRPGVAVSPTWSASK